MPFSVANLILPGTNRRGPAKASFVEAGTWDPTTAFQPSGAAIQWPGAVSATLEPAPHASPSMCRWCEAGDSTRHTVCAWQPKRRPISLSPVQAKHLHACQRTYHHCHATAASLYHHCTIIVPSLHHHCTITVSSLYHHSGNHCSVIIAIAVPSLNHNHCARCRHDRVPGVSWRNVWPGERRIDLQNMSDWSTVLWRLSSNCHH